MILVTSWNHIKTYPKFDKNNKYYFILTFKKLFIIIKILTKK